MQIAFLAYKDYLPSDETPTYVSDDKAEPTRKIIIANIFFITIIILTMQTHTTATPCEKREDEMVFELAVKIKMA